MDIYIRLEKPEDYHKVEELTREAFWGTTTQECDEHYLVHKLRTSAAFIPELDYVAVVDGEIAGNIMYSISRVSDSDGTDVEVITLGPLSVHPKFKNRGIGAELVKYTIEEARRLGYRAIIIFGHPDYYTRFGFKPAGEFGITTSDGMNFDAFMALALYDKALEGAAGKFYEDSVFHFDGKEAEEFDKGFPFKEKCFHISVSELMEMLPLEAQESVKEHELERLIDFSRFSAREIASWKGIGRQEKKRINEMLEKHGFPLKKWK